MNTRALAERIRERLSQPDPDQHAQVAELLLSLGDEAAGLWAAARPRGRPTPDWLHEVAALGRSLPPDGLADLTASILPASPLVEAAAFWMGARAVLDPSTFFARLGRPQQPLGGDWVDLPGGIFRMGSRRPDTDAWERPSHLVSLAPYAILSAPVTRAQLSRMAGGEGSTLPAGEVTWLEAWLFAEWAGAALPTEAQWENACRAGTDAPWSAGYTHAELAAAAWFADNAGGRVRPVRSRAPNPWGLHDMHGNVMEWCADQQRIYHAASAAQLDPGRGQQAAPLPLHSAMFRVARGGYYGATAAQCRSAHRAVFDLFSCFDGLGFRLVRPEPVH